MAVIGSLSVKLGLVTVEWDKATAQAKRQAKELQSAVQNLTGGISSLNQVFQKFGGMAGISTAGILALGRATFTWAGQVNDLAASYDVSVSKLLQFQQAIQAAGGSAENANRIMATMFDKISAAREGNDEARKTFEQLGISLTQLNTLQPDQMIGKVVTGLNNVGDTYKRIALVKDVLGKSGIGLSISDLSTALNKTTTDADSTAEAVKRLDDFGDALAATMTNVKMAMADILAPFVGSTGNEALLTINQIKAAMAAMASAWMLGKLADLLKIYLLIEKARKEQLKVEVALTALTGARGLIMAAGAIATYTIVSNILDDNLDKADKYKKQLESLPQAEQNAQAKLKNITTVPQGMYFNAEAGVSIVPEEIQKIASRPLGLIGQWKNKKELFEEIKNDAGQVKIPIEFNKPELKASDFKVPTLTVPVAFQKPEFNKKDFEIPFDTAKQILQAQTLPIPQISVMSDIDMEARKIMQANAEKTQTIKDQIELNKTLLSLQRQSNTLAESSSSIDKTDLTIQQAAIKYLQDLAELENRYIQDTRKAQEEGLNTDVIEIKYGQDKLKLAQDLSNAAITARQELAKTNLLSDISLDYLKQSNQLELQSLMIQGQSYSLSAEEVKQQELLLDHKKKMTQLAEQEATARASLTGDTLTNQLNTIETQKQAEQDLYDVRRMALQAEQERQSSFSAGWDQAFQQYAERATDAAQTGADMFNTLTDDMTNGILEFARTGKFAFSDFARSVIADLLRIAIRAQMTQILSGVFSAFSGVPSSVSINTEGMTGTIDLSSINLPAHAAGGFTDGASIVGENGPELFIPNRPGTIIPNARMSDAMGGQPSVVYNGPYIANMSAIDTQSATQFLARNRNAVFAANQSAQRSMPVSR